MFPGIAANPKQWPSVSELWEKKKKILTQSVFAKCDQKKSGTASPAVELFLSLLPADPPELKSLAPRLASVRQLKEELSSFSPSAQPAARLVEEPCRDASDGRKEDHPAQNADLVSLLRRRVVRSVLLAPQMRRSARPAHTIQTQHRRSASSARWASFRILKAIRRAGRAHRATTARRARRRHCRAPKARTRTRACHS